MHTEIEYATNFLVETIKQNIDIALATCEKLRDRLKFHLEKRYENHWYSDKPMKGSAYRCINVSREDGSVDLVLRQAAEDCGLSLSDILNIFSNGLALWVDPNDVSCRLGKGAIFPIYKKINDGNTSQNSSMTANVYTQRRPQQRPRSMSPPQHNNVTNATYQQNQYQTRPRSTTPPGFSSQDAGKLYQTYSRPVLSSDNLQKLWNTIPNTTKYNSLMTKAPATYSPAGGSKNNVNVIDTSYSFNKYSSYYNTTSTEWKRNYKNQQFKQAKYNNWQDDETYNRYHWSRRNASNTMTSIAANNLNYGNYSMSPRQAQEVC